MYNSIFTYLFPCPVWFRLHRDTSTDSTVSLVTFPFLSCSPGILGLGRAYLYPRAEIYWVDNLSSSQSGYNMPLLVEFITYSSCHVVVIMPITLQQLKLSHIYTTRYSISTSSIDIKPNVPIPIQLQHYYKSYHLNIKYNNNYTSCKKASSSSKRYNTSTQCIAADILAIANFNHPTTATHALSICSLKCFSTSTQSNSGDFSTASYNNILMSPDVKPSQPRLIASESMNGRSKLYFIDSINTMHKHSNTPNDSLNKPLRGRWLAVADIDRLDKTILYNSDTKYLEQLPLSTRISQGVKNWFLPSGYPTTVHKSYLAFSLWTGVEQFIANVTSVLCTSSMLYSVGVISTTATGVASTIQWVVKDGIADSGKLVFNRLYSHTFDVYPKTWKMVGEVLVGVGFACQLATAAAGPSYFLLLAAGGSLLKGLSYMIWYVHGSCKYNIIKCNCIN